MRKLCLILTTLSLMLLAFAPTMAQDSTTKAPPAYLLFGAKYDNAEGLTTTLGGIVNLGKGFYGLGYGDVGDKSTASFETARLLDFGPLKIGPLVGFNSEWIEEASTVGTSDADFLNYVVGAGGMLAVLNLGERAILTGMYKHQLPLEESGYPGFNVFGLAIGASFSGP